MSKCSDYFSRMEMGVFLLIFLGVFKGYLCQNNNGTLPSERGLIISVLDHNTPTYAVIRHIPVFLGYESFNGSIPGIKITSSSNTRVLSIDVDFRSKEFFVYDYHLGSILIGSGYHKDLDHTKIDIDIMHAGVSKGNVQIAYDWLSKMVYWTDSMYRWILAAPGQKSKLVKDYYKIIVDDHLDAPDGITVDPLEGYLFWSDNGRHPKLERSDLDGQNRHTIVTKHLRSPVSIKADVIGKRVYWINSLTDEVLSATYEGKDIKLIRRIPSSLLFDIAIYKDVVYVSDIYHDDLYTLNKMNGRLRSTTLRITNETIYSVAVYGEETQPLKDKDYCGMKNCSQICITEKNGAKCMCSEGFKFNETTGVCQESSAQFHKAVVFSNSTHICLMDIRGLSSNAYGLVCRFTVSQSSSPAMSSATLSPPATTSNIKMFDLDVENRVIYFATEDNMIYRRPVDLPIENNAVELIDEARGIISGLAYDVRYSNNLYWSESNTNSIWYVDTTTKSSLKLLPSGNSPLVKPRDIIVLPHVRMLAWVAGNSGQVSIQTMDVAGGNIRTIISNLPEIVSMVYDHEARMFYFISNEKIHRVALNGTKLPLVSLENPSAYILLSYNNYLAWVYNSTQYGNVLKTKDFGKGKTMLHVILDNAALFNGIKALDNNLKLPDASPCTYLNGGCEQVCIPRYSNNVMGKVCKCSLGFKLQSDGVSCRSDVTMDNFLLVTDWTNGAVHQIDLKTHDINSVYNKERTVYMGIYYDDTAQRILWTEYTKGRIFSSKLDGSDQKTIGNLGGFTPYRIDKDMTTGNIYYTVFGQNAHIGIFTPSGTNIKLRSAVVPEYFRDIVLHPGRGWMFYSIYKYSNGSFIARANMDGTNEKKIIFGDHVKDPDGLAIDFTNDTLYWSDALKDTIQRCNFDGEDCITIVNKTGTYKPEEITDVVTDGQYLYYSSYLNDHVVRIDLNRPNVTEPVGQNPSLGKLDTIALYKSSSKNKQPVSQACKDRNGLGNCSTICLPTETGRTCACEDDKPLTIDGRTCSNIYQCSDVIRQDVQSTKGKVTIDIVINRQCNRWVNDQCSYTCPAFYMPTKASKLLLTCTNVGWDRETEPLCKEQVCPADPVTNGKIIDECGRRPGDACKFECSKGFKNTTDMILCDNKLNWSPRQICAEEAPSAAAKQTSGLPVGGVAAIVVVLVVIIICLVLVVVFLLLRRRRAARQSATTAEFHKGQDGTIAIENPGYIPSQPATVDTSGEHPYSTVDPGQVYLGETEADKLPEVTQVTHDTAVLTMDSWLKERQKN